MKILTPFSNIGNMTTETMQYSDSALKNYDIVGGFVVNNPSQIVTVNNSLLEAAGGGAAAKITESIKFDGCPSVKFIDAGLGYYTFRQTGFNSRNFTFLGRFKMNDAGDNSTALRMLPLASGNTILIWRNGTTFDMRINGSDYTGAGTFNYDEWYDIEIIGTETACVLYVNGSVVINGAAAAAGTITSGFYFCNMVTTSNYQEYVYLLLCNRSLSLNDIGSIKNNPWQLFSRNTIAPISTRLPKRNI